MVTEKKFMIKKVNAQEIFDSRGNPTIEVELVSQTGISARAAVPSGKSTGANEALELRDNDKNRYHGKGVLKAISNIKKHISPAIIGMDIRESQKIDQKMIKLDGTPLKRKLGANAILGVSLATIRLAAKTKQVPLYEHIYHLAYDKKPDQYLLPVPMANVINGGEHAGGNLAPQEFMIMPVNFSDFREGVRAIAEIYVSLRNILQDKYGPEATNVGDEGGFGSPVDTSDEALSLLEKATEAAGYKVKQDICFALDPAATEFYEDDAYHIDGDKLTEMELVDYWVNLIDSYPIVSLEDPFNEESFKAFAELRKKVNDEVQIVGDDLTVTNISRLEKAIEMNSINSLLMKINQIGTISESINAAKTCWEEGYSVVVSHRSGETEDTAIADLAVGLCTGQIKTGSIARGERTAKYNQLLRINDSLDSKAIYPGKAFRTAFKKFI